MRPRTPLLLLLTPLALLFVFSPVSVARTTKTAKKAASGKHAKATTKSAQRHAAARTPESFAVGTIDGGVWIPLGCWDASAKKTRFGEECLALVPADAPVLLSGKRKAVLREEKQAECDPSAETARGRRVEGAPDGSAWALWPPAAASRLTGFEAPDLASGQAPAAVAVPDAVRAQMAALAGAAERAKDVQVWQQAAFDVDRDGKPETFWSVVIPDPDGNTAHPAFGGLLWKRSKSKAVPKPALRVMESSSLYEFAVEAGVDFPGLPTRYVVLRSTYYEGDAEALVTSTGDGLVVAAQWGCGA